MKKKCISIERHTIRLKERELYHLHDWEHMYTKSQAIQLCRYCALNIEK